MTYLEVREKWLAALQQYEAYPRSSDVPSELHQSLKQLEDMMLQMPPPGCGKGLLFDDTPRSINEVTPGEAGIPVIPRNQWAELIAEKNSLNAWPSEYVYHVFNQGQVGSCASEAKDGAMMVVRAISNQEKVIFNPYGTYGRVNGGRDAGSSLTANIEFAQKYGCFPEDIWPRSKGWRPEPSREAYAEAAKYKLREVVRLRTIDEFGSALLAGFPVYFGYPGHAIFAIKLIDANRFWYQNSWGANWGKNGAATLSFSSIEWNYGAFAFLSETWSGS